MSKHSHQCKKIELNRNHLSRIRLASKLIKNNYCNRKARPETTRDSSETAPRRGRKYPETTRDRSETCSKIKCFAFEFLLEMKHFSTKNISFIYFLIFFVQVLAKMVKTAQNSSKPPSFGFFFTPWGPAVRLVQLSNAHFGAPKRGGKKTQICNCLQMWVRL